MIQVKPLDLLDESRQKLKKNIHEEEIMSIIHLLFEGIFRWDRSKIMINDDSKVSHEELDEFNRAIERILNNEPVQYILGKAYFYSNEFEVNRNVLIPRNETEELVELIKNEIKRSDLRMLDIGTGSGCIACTLAHEIRGSSVYAIDICSEALDVARRNAERLKCNVEFVHSDILKDDIPIKHLDIIVSNPPYVMEDERSLMLPNVLDYEPSEALFVSNSDPLVFYRHILQKSKAVLNEGGKVYFEINEQMGQKMVELCESFNYSQIRVHKDIHGKDRIVSCKI